MSLRFYVPTYVEDDLITAELLIFCEDCRLVYTKVLIIEDLITDTP